MKNICLCFQVHHPFHFQTFRFFDIGSNKSYYDDLRIDREINEIAVNYYLPTNNFLLKLINKFKGKLKVAFYISGTAIDQFLMYEPEVLTSFRQLADNGQVEFFGGTASHSLISLANQKYDFQHQLHEYSTRIRNLFGKDPKVFVNTDLLYSDQIGKDVWEAGFTNMLTNGSKKTLMWQSPNYVYSNYFQSKMNVFFRNELVSDELVNQLNRLDSDEKEIKIYDFISLINNQGLKEPILNIYLDYKNLGGYRMDKKQNFIHAIVSQIVGSGNLKFILPSEVAEQYGPVSEIKAEEPITWVNNFHSYYYPWNVLQKESIKQLYKLNKLMEQIDNLNLQKDWQYLQTSDHIHLMDDQHPTYRNISDSIYKSKYDAFINYMNILDDFRLKIKKANRKIDKKQLSKLDKDISGNQIDTINKNNFQ